mgnify:CR=1 FL=1
MDSTNSFENKVVLITGAARGIGKATAIEFAKNNAKVIAVSRTMDDLLELQKQFPKNIEVWDFDMPFRAGATERFRLAVNWFKENW